MNKLEAKQQDDKVVEEGLTTVQQRSFEKYLVERLKDPEEAKAHLELAIEEYSRDLNSKALMLMMRLIAEAQGGIGLLAERSHLNRQNLYKILTCKTVPRLDTTMAIIKGLGFRMNVENSEMPNLSL